MTFLKRPVLSKTVQRFGNERVKVGVAAMQGYRGGAFTNPIILSQAAFVSAPVLLFLIRTSVGL